MNEPTLDPDCQRWLERYLSRLKFSQRECSCGCHGLVPLPSYLRSDRPIPRYLRGHNNKPPDPIGERYGHWTVLARVDADTWRCRCDCGTERVLYLKNLKRRTSTNCGCLTHRTQDG